MIKNFRLIEIGSGRFCRCGDGNMCVLAKWDYCNGEYYCRRYSKTVLGGLIEPERCKACVADDDLLPRRETRGKLA